MIYLKKYLNIRHITLAVLGLFALVAGFVTKDAQQANADDGLKLASAAEGQDCNLSGAEEFSVKKKPTAFISCAGYLE